MNSERENAEKKISELQERFKDSTGVFISPDVYLESSRSIDIIDENASLTIGKESIFWGENSSVNVFREGRLEIGERTTIGDNNKIFCRDSIKIGNYVMTAWEVTIYDYDPHPVDPKLRKKQVDYMTAKFNPFSSMAESELSESEISYFDCYWEGSDNYNHSPVTIGDNVWIGFGVSIFKGVTIGDNCVIAANSVVTKDIPPNSVAAGVPAKVFKEI